MRKTRGARWPTAAELFYFDDVTAEREVLPDTRDLPHVSHGSTMRFDVLTGEWVTIAAHRKDRTYMPPADHCPLCPTPPGREPSEIPAPTTTSSCSRTASPRSPSRRRSVAREVDGNPLWPQRPAVGRCEVVVLHQRPQRGVRRRCRSRRVRTVIEAWADRTAALSALPGVEQVFPLREPRRRRSGSRCSHPHGQIYAYPFVTPRTAQLLTQAGVAPRSAPGRDLLGDVLDSERRRAPGSCSDGEAGRAYVPAAARWPVEAHLVPHRAVPDMAALDDAERDELAVIYRDLLHRLERVFGEPMELPYIAGVAPGADPRPDATSPGCTCSCSRCAGRPASSSSSPGRSPGWRRGSTTSRRSRSPSGCGRRARERGGWAAPGRVNLIGEHVDYADGLCLPFAIAERTVVTAAPRARRAAHRAERGRGHRGRGRARRRRAGVAVGLGGLRRGRALGVAGGRARGRRARRARSPTTVPLGAGLSSSAALECAVALAANDIYDLGLDRADARPGCVRAENDVVGAATGGMDQAASLLARRGTRCSSTSATAARARCRSRLADDGLRAAGDRHPGAPPPRRRAVRPAPRRRREGGRTAWACRACGDATARTSRGSTASCRKRARHIVTEIARVREVVAALDAGRLAEIGPLLDASHASLARDYEVSCAGAGPGVRGRARRRCARGPDDRRRVRRLGDRARAVQPGRRRHRLGARAFAAQGFRRARHPGGDPVGGRDPPVGS